MQYTVVNRMFKIKKYLIRIKKSGTIVPLFFILIKYFLILNIRFTTVYCINRTSEIVNYEFNILVPIQSPNLPDLR